MRAKALRTLAVLASLPVLAACDIDAHVAVGGDDTVTLDVTYWGTGHATDENGNDVTATADPCDFGLGYATGVSREPLRDPADPHHYGCHITGQTTLAVLARVNDGPEWLLHEGGRYHVYVPAIFIRWTGLDPTGADASVTDRGTFRAEVTFPGPVTGHDASARVEGNTVIWDNRGARDLGGAWATSLEEGQFTAATWAQLAAFAGAVTGAAGVSAWLLRASRRRDGSAPATPGAEAAPDAPDPVGPQGADVEAASDPSDPPDTPAADDPTVWAPGPDDDWPGR